MKDVIGFGALNVDFIYRVASLTSLETRDRRLKPGGEVYASLEEFEPTLSKLAKVGTLASKSGGGQAANTAFALAKMGFSTGIIGKVGTDPNGDFLVRSMESVDTSYLVQEGVSGVCLALLDKSRDRSNLVFPNVNDEIVFDELDIDYIFNTKYLYLTSFVGEAPFAVQKKLVESVPSRVKIAFDPGEIYARKGIEQLLPILQKTSILFITDEEINIITGKDHRAGTAMLLDMGPEIVICKMGEEGSYLLSDGTEFQIPVPKVKAVDRTGAGDVFAAGFLAGQLMGKSLYNSALFATQAASASITEFGRARYPDKRFLLDKLK